MSSRFRLPAALLEVALSVLVVALIARPSAADSRPGLYAPAGDRAADGALYLFMHETTSLRADGGGEERIEFLVTNDGLSTLDRAEFYFENVSDQLWGVEAWDEAGSLDHAILIEGDRVYVTVYFREGVGVGEQYRYFFAINFPGLAQESGGEWGLRWTTNFPVAEFVRTVNLPGGASVTYVDPTPTEQTADFVRWVRYVMFQFVFELRYTLRALTEQELAEEFAPYFRMHPREDYVPMPVDLALNHADCIFNPIPLINECFPPGELTLERLMAEWLNRSASFINFRGNPHLEVGPIVGSHEYYLEHVKDDADRAPTVYARVVPVGGYTVIQYWLYYYYNSWGMQDDLPGVLGLHEGDWEMIQVVLDGDDRPLYAAYAQHLDLNFADLKGASKKEWNDLDRETTNGDHPIVYPGLGSHASYFGPYKFLGNTDLTGPETADAIKPAVYLLQETTTDRWVTYQGRWGEPGIPSGGPRSPANQGDKWSNPLGWAESAIDWDEYAGHHIGKVRAHTDAPCNVGVKVQDTGKSFGWVFNEYKEEIDGGEYVVNETNETRSLILHNTYKLATWLYVVYTTCPANVTPSARDTAETPTLTVEFYDAASDELVTAQYVLPADWQPETTIASLTLGDPAALDLAVDQDNDGDIDQTVPPQSVISEPIEEPGGAEDKLYIPVVLSD